LTITSSASFVIAESAIWMILWTFELAREDSSWWVKKSWVIAFYTVTLIGIMGAILDRMNNTVGSKINWIEAFITLLKISVLHWTEPAFLGISASLTFTFIQIPALITYGACGLVCILTINEASFCRIHTTSFNKNQSFFTFSTKS